MIEGIPLLIVGLGNPGKKYELTRHNVGFWVVDKFVKNLNGSWVTDSKCNCALSEFNISGKKITCMKPLTFMNLSGDSVREFLRWNDVDKLVVVYDELDFEAGAVKLKKSGSAGGHNGLADIIQKTNDANIAQGRFADGKFLRVRLGIGHPRNSQTPMMEVKNWVLTKADDRDFDKLVKASEVTSEGLKILSEESNIETAEKLFRSFLDKKKER